MDQEKTPQQSVPPGELEHLEQILRMVNEELEEAEPEHRHTAAPQAREHGLAEEHLRADGLLGHSAPSRSKVTTKSVPS